MCPFLIPPKIIRLCQRYLSFDFLGKVYLMFRKSSVKTVLNVKISLRLFTTLRELAGKGEETLEFAEKSVTVKEVLEELVRHHGKSFKDHLYNEKGYVQEYLQILVNGKSVRLLAELETRLKEGDELAIVPPVGGG